ncbi:hemin ABC transporter periplasmic protein [Sporocytophaga myxococcoides]|uniref:Hemin ABC transporter periplasmic protein n=1 Tax=Sporocytophaga myxococcoides TaxID=153721 RepID=A0A098L9B2_9BACT|nr:ABC transporter substrate-binding protein [Sporocytophaga myxococcoides]GAL83491.1 hemin ABC transporter periplasmic protein [Sporocytophaga myxococcoides]
MKRLILPVLVLFVCDACGRFGNEVKKEGRQERIVCIAKQYNEIIYALGAQDNLVAVDVSSTYPGEIKKLPTVGYHRALSAEGMIAAQPSLIIHDNNVGPEHVMSQMEKLQIPMKTFSRAKDIEETKALIKEMGTYFHKEIQADSLCRKIDNDLNAALKSERPIVDTPDVVIIHYGRAMNVYLVMTQLSNAAQMVTWAGGRVPVTGDKGMQNISAEIIADANPDIILLTDFGYDRLGTPEKIKELPGIATTKAAKKNRIYRFEEHDLVYFGPRIGENILKMKKLFHSDE